MEQSVQLSMAVTMFVSPCCSVEGGELFDRIIDENYNLTELDTVLFIRQICEGLKYMHKNYILHLDLKVNLLRILYSSYNTIYCLLFML